MPLIPADKIFLEEAAAAGLSQEDAMIALDKQKSKDASPLYKSILRNIANVPGGVEALNKKLIEVETRKLDPVAMAEDRVKAGGSSFVKEAGESVDTAKDVISFVDKLPGGPLITAPTKGVIKSGEIIRDTFGAAKEGFETIQVAGEQAGEAIYGIDVETGEDLAPSERVVKGGGALADLMGGSMGVVFSPITGVLDNAPQPIKGVADVSMELLNEGSLMASKKFKEKFGIAEGTEQAEVIDKLFGVVANLFLLKATRSYSGARRTAGLRSGDTIPRQGESVPVKPSFLERVATQERKVTGKVSEVAGTKLESAGVGLDRIAEGLGKKVGEKTGKIAEAIAKKKLAKKGNKVAKLEEGIKKDVDSFIEGNKSFSRKVNELGKTGTDIKQILSDPHTFKGLKIENGIVNPDGAINTIQGKINMLLDAKSKILPEVSKFTPKIPKERLRDTAVKYLEEEGMLEADLADAIARLDRQLAAQPAELSIVQMDALRAKARKSSRNAKGQLKSQSEFAALENASREIVFDATDGLVAGSKGELAALNVQIKNLIAAEKFLDKTIRGAKVKGGRLGKISGRMIGVVAGTPGGVIGSLLGAEVGAVVADIVMNNQLGSSLKMKLVKTMVNDTALVAEIAKLVEEVQSFRPPELGAPTTEFRTQTPSGKTIELPGKSPSTIEALESQRNSLQTDQSIPTNNIPKNSITKL